MRHTTHITIRILKKLFFWSWLSDHYKPRSQVNIASPPPPPPLQSNIVTLVPLANTDRGFRSWKFRLKSYNPPSLLATTLSLLDALIVWSRCRVSPSRIDLSSEYVCNNNSNLSNNVFNGYVQYGENVTKVDLDDLFWVHFYWSDSILAPLSGPNACGGPHTTPSCRFATPPWAGPRLSDFFFICSGIDR